MSLGGLLRDSGFGRESWKIRNETQRDVLFTLAPRKRTNENPRLVQMSHFPFLYEKICSPKNPWDVGVKTTCLEAPGVSLGGSGFSIGGVRILRVNILF